MKEEEGGKLSRYYDNASFLESGLHGDRFFREGSPFSLSSLRSLSSGNAPSQPDEDRSRSRPDLGGNSVGWRPEKRPLSEEAERSAFPGCFRIGSPLPALTSGASLSRFPMSGEPAAPENTRFKASALGGRESGGSGDRCCLSGAEDQEKRVAAASPLPPPPGTFGTAVRKRRRGKPLCLSGLKLPRRWAEDPAEGQAGLEGCELFEEGVSSATKFPPCDLWLGPCKAGIQQVKPSRQQGHVRCCHPYSISCVWRTRCLA